MVVALPIISIFSTVLRCHSQTPGIPATNCYLEREIANHLASGISKSHACAIAIGLLERVGCHHE